MKLILTDNLSEKNRTPIDKYVIDILNNHVYNYTFGCFRLRSGFGYVDSQKMLTRFNERGQYLIIYKDIDDYYYVESFQNLHRVYLCDQLEGLLEFFDFFN